MQRVDVAPGGKALTVIWQNPTLASAALPRMSTRDNLIDTVTYAAKGGQHGFAAIDPADSSAVTTTPIGSSVDDDTLQMVGTLGTKRGLFSVSAADPPPCAPSCEDIDLVRDRVIDGSDLAVLLAEWGTVKGAAAADFNDDSEVNSLDLGLLVGAWGPCVG